VLSVIASCTCVAKMQYVIITKEKVSEQFCNVYACNGIRT